MIHQALEERLFYKQLQSILCFAPTMKTTELLKQSIQISS